MKVEDWIRCNKCFQTLRESSQCFSVTQCQHIFCQRCCIASRSLARGTCPECKTDGIRLMTLKQPWDRTILAPFCRSLPEMMLQANQAAEFQRAQALIALRRHDQIEVNYEKLKRGYAQIERNRRALKQHTQQIEEKIHKLERQFVHLQNKRERTRPSTNRETNFLSASDPRNKKQPNFPPCFPTPSDSGHSFHSALDRRYDDSPDPAEFPPRSNRRHRNFPAFTPERYSSRAVFSDDTSMTSGNT